MDTPNPTEPTVQAHLTRALAAYQAHAWQMLGQELATVGDLDPGILGRTSSTQAQYWLLLLALVQHDAAQLKALGVLPTSVPNIEAVEVLDHLSDMVSSMARALATPGITAPPGLAICEAILAAIDALRQPQEG